MHWLIYYILGPEKQKDCDPSVCTFFRGGQKKCLNETKIKTISHPAVAHVCLSLCIIETTKCVLLQTVTTQIDDAAFHQGLQWQIQRGFMGFDQTPTPSI